MKGKKIPVEAGYNVTCWKLDGSASGMECSVNPPNKIGITIGKVNGLSLKTDGETTMIEDMKIPSLNVQTSAYVHEIRDGKGACWVEQKEPFTIDKMVGGKKVKVEINDASLLSCKPA